MDLNLLKAAARSQRQVATETKNRVLRALADRLRAFEAEILRANAIDLAALAPATTAAFRDRLTLSPPRLEQMAESLRQVAALPDPVGEVIEQKTLANGLRLERVRGPLGVIFMIFESRPNVILEAFSLAFKSGNVILLRGGSESKNTAAVLYQVMRDCLQENGLDPLPFQAVEDYARERVAELLKRRDLIDVVVPRGGDQLIAFVQDTATMPIIKNDRGMCHAFIDQGADLRMAEAIVVNGKVQRPGVCNSLETVLVDSLIAAEFLPRLFAAMPTVEWHVDAASLEILSRLAGSTPRVRLAEDADWDAESLDLILNCRVVAGLDQALAHIERHGSKHSEVIVTANAPHARRFQSEVDAAAVYWNASTRFTDGFEFGLGGELGISTQKLHVRGPVGLRELTIARWIGTGQGQIR